MTRNEKIHTVCKVHMRTPKLRRRWSQNWTDKLSIDEFVANFFVLRKSEWVLHLAVEKLENPHSTYSGWFMQFGGALELIGQERALEMRNLYKEVTASKEFQKAKRYRFFWHCHLGLLTQKREKNKLTYKLSDVQFSD